LLTNQPNVMKLFCHLILVSSLIKVSVQEISVKIKDIVKRFHVINLLPPEISVKNCKLIE